MLQVKDLQVKHLLLEVTGDDLASQDSKIANEHKAFKDSLPEFPTSSYFEHLLENLKTIRNTKYVFKTTPEIPEQPLNTYAKFNAIEKILYDVYTLYNNQFNYYCGEDYYCGDSVGMLL